jgi:mRNA interferase RelE/StbE
MAYSIEFRPTARKMIAKLPRSVAKRIEPAIQALADNPRPAGSVKLHGYDHMWRIRVGNYRVVYEIQDDNQIIVILVVAHRRESYRGL